MDKASEGTGLDNNFMGIFINLCRNCLRFIKDLLSLVVSMRLADFNWGYNLKSGRHTNNHNVWRFVLGTGCILHCKFSVKSLFGDFRGIT